MASSTASPGLGPPTISLPSFASFEMGPHVSPRSSHSSRSGSREAGHFRLPESNTRGAPSRKRKKSAEMSDR